MSICVHLWLKFSFACLVVLPVIGFYGSNTFVIFAFLVVSCFVLHALADWQPLGLWQTFLAFMNDLTQSRWLPIVLLTCSNLFMTIAWYGHLKYKSKPLLLVILVSWGIALFEYILQVPANRWGSNSFSPYQLKIIQEVITLLVFVVFAFFYFKTLPAWNHIAAFVCVVAAVAFAFWPKP